VIAKSEDDFLVREKLIKGSMRLVETSEAERLYALMGQAIQTSGGCAGNTVAGVASFGGRAAFIGKVAEDELGRVYRTTCMQSASISRRRPCTTVIRRHAR